MSQKELTALAKKIQDKRNAQLDKIGKNFSLQLAKK